RPGHRRGGVEPAGLGPADRKDPPRPAAARRQPPARHRRLRAAGRRAAFVPDRRRARHRRGGNGKERAAGRVELAAAAAYRLHGAGRRAQRGTAEAEPRRHRLAPGGRPGRTIGRRQCRHAAVSLLPVLERAIRRTQSRAGRRPSRSAGVRMKAVALTRDLPIDDPQSLLDVELPRPSAPAGHDLLVRVEAVSVNPVDTKVRAPKPQVEPAPKVLGFDAAGVVEAVGDQVTGFKPGDEVYYRSDITRPGSTGEGHRVDARSVGHKPKSLEFAQAAALPVTAITAWELLFQRMPFDPEHGGDGKVLLVIAGAGGVGSIATQLARRAGFTLVATAS